jgi:chitosanase
MSEQPNQAISPDAIRRLIEAAQAIDAVASRLAEVAASAAGGPGIRGADGGAKGAAAASLVLTASQRALCERVINVFETGSVRGRYGAIAIFEDGPNDIRQITYGRSQTTEYGNLRDLVERYVAAGGRFADQLRPFVPLIGRTPLVDDATFIDLLRRAGDEDPAMQPVQDEFFDDRYFAPALRWAGQNGFGRALSALVIYDSFIHSGGILDFLRARFAELPPARGGDEQAWVRQYVDVRHAWLLGHPRPAVRASAYRTRDLAREIARGNWELADVPILANGVPVDDGGIAAAPAAAAGDADDIPYLGPAPASSGDGERAWCEASRASHGLDSPRPVAAADGSAAALARRILDDPHISLATGHVSGVRDQATVKQNIQDTAAGRQAQRSAYGNAPGGSVALDGRMLSGLLSLAHDYSFSVSELVGGSHSPHSRHYAGVTADINIINGLAVQPHHRDVPAFMAQCRALGATEVLGPGDPDHDNHVHAAWPLPAA